MSRPHSRLPASTRLHVVLALLCVPACGGRSVNLDQSSATSATAFDGGVEVTTPINEEIGLFWVDDTRVYWQGESLGSCVCENCAATRITYGSSAGRPLTLGTNDVFFADVYDKLYRCPKGGCPGKPIFFLQDFASQGVAADAEYLYWSSTFDIYRCPLADCGDIPDLVSAREKGDDFRLQDSDLYYRLVSDYSKPEDVPALEIHYVPTNGSVPPVVVALGGKAMRNGAWSSFTTDSQKIYWIDSDYRIQSCPRRGCSSDEPPVTLVDTDEAKDHIQVDGIGVYWQSGQLSPAPGNTVMFCPFSGCSAGSPPRALTPTGVQSFALDSTHLYWNDVKLVTDGYRADHLIHQVAKPTP